MVDRFTKALPKEVEFGYEGLLCNPYSANALKIGRPLTSVVIISNEITGAEKSSVVTSIFALQRTSEREPLAESIQILQNSISIPEVNCNSSRNFTVIEMSSSSADKAAETFLDVLSDYGDYKDRRNREQSNVLLAHSVFPNVFLLTIVATENRIRGNNSTIRKLLEQIVLAGGLVDTQLTNLIVVVTNSCALGLNRETFQKKFAKLKEHIVSVILDVFGICNIDVIPVEMNPEAYELDLLDEELVLPNGEKALSNLKHAMLQLAIRNEDKLLELALQRMHQAKSSHNPTQFFIHKSTVLGYGYCPVKEEYTPCSLVGNVNVIENDFQAILMEGNVIQFPKYIEVVENNFTQIWERYTSLTKAKYEENMKTFYDIDKKIRLNVLGKPDGRWLQNADMVDKENYDFSYKKGFRMAKLRLDQPKIALRNSEFCNILYNLPDVYNDTTISKFKNFFDYWGTHIVIETSIGGSIELRSSFYSASFARSSINGITEMLAEVYQNLYFDGFKVKTAQKCLNMLGLFQGRITLDGGNIQKSYYLDNMTDLIVMDWVNSIKSKPVESRFDVKLHPYYKLLKDEKQKYALYKATLGFLSGQLNPDYEAYESDFRKELSEMAVNRARRMSEDLLIPE